MLTGKTRGRETLHDDLHDKIESMTREYAVQMFGRKFADVKVKLTKTMLRNCGKCHFWKDNVPKKLCTYSHPFMELNSDNEEVIRWVVVHEVAHLKHQHHTQDHSDLCSRYGVDADGFPPGTRHVKKRFAVRCSCGHRVRSYFRKPSSGRKRIKCSRCGRIAKHWVVKL